MPRENRKRGKKHKKQPQEEEAALPASAPVEEDHSAGPSWIKPAPNRENEYNAEAPFGYVDADVKAYFRTVDVQIQEWVDNAADAQEGDEDHDPNEDRRMFFVAALQEMSGKEKQLSTDPDCSIILERMIYSMDDLVRRIFVDSLSGSYEQLVKHRFASHVCQTMFTVASQTVSRETRGILPPRQEDSEQNDLRTMGQLILDVCEELLPSFTSLIMDPFASHVLRALLILLSPTLLSSSSASSGTLHSTMRSKKSAAWKARQGSLKSMFSEDGQTSQAKLPQVPDSFASAARKILYAVRNELGDNEVRALAADKVASPVLQLLLELEADQNIADEPNSLMDRVLVGLITSVHTFPDDVPPPSDYLATLLRDPTSSHLLETLVARTPAPAFALLHQTYFAGKLARLAVHPVANFVVARALGRADAAVLAQAVEELAPAVGKVIKAARVGVVRALVERAAALGVCQVEMVEAIYGAFELDASSTEDKALFVPCVLRLKTKSEYMAAVTAKPSQPQDEHKDAAKSKAKHAPRRPVEDPLAPSIQGSLLLQSLLKLAEPHNRVVTESIQAMSVDDLLALAHDATSSRVLDALMEASTVPKMAKRKFIMGFIGSFHLLMDDRIGSRVGDRLWAASDPYLKEKIGRSLFPQEHFLAGSYYGKFFARRLNLHILRRNSEEWKTLQASSTGSVDGAAPLVHPKPSVGQSSLAKASAPTTAADTAVSADAVPAEGGVKSKKKRKAEDEIDVLFDDAGLAKRKKKGALPTSDAGDKGSIDQPDAMAERGEKKKKKSRKEIGDAGDLDLGNVLDAIRSAPKSDSAPTKGKKGRVKT